MTGYWRERGRAPFPWILAALLGIPAGLAVFAAGFWVWLRYGDADTLISL